jgi:hypothetical protein
VRGGLRCNFGEGSLSAWVTSQGACEAKGREGGIRCVPHGERDSGGVLTRAQRGGGSSEQPAAEGGVRVAWRAKGKKGVSQGFCRGGGVRDREEFEGAEITAMTGRWWPSLSIEGAEEKGKEGGREIGAVITNVGPSGRGSVWDGWISNPGGICGVAR